MVLFFLPGAGHTLLALDKRCDDVRSSLALHTDALPSGTAGNKTGNSANSYLNSNNKYCETAPKIQTTMKKYYETVTKML